MGNEDQVETAKQELVSIVAVKRVHDLLSRLETKLKPVLRAENVAKESTPPQSNSPLMEELGYVQNRLNSILDRIHV